MAFSYKTGNPVLGTDTFIKEAYKSKTSEVMTLEGAVNKIAILLGVLITCAALSWYLIANNSSLFGMLVIGGSIGGLIVAIVLAFNKTLAPTLAPIYSVLEGLAVGGISAYYEHFFNGIVMQALLLTLLIFGSLLFFYKTRIIKATENFKLIVGSATAGIFLFYLVSFILGFFGVSIPLLHSNGPIGIGFSLFVVAIAALNLVMDFDFIEQGAEQKAPKYMEWYAAFGLVVTLVWLYLEILRLLSKLRSE